MTDTLIAQIDEALIASDGPTRLRLLREARAALVQQQAEIATAHKALDEISAPLEDGVGTLSLNGRCWELSNRWAAEQEKAEAQLREARAALVQLQGEIEEEQKATQHTYRAGFEHGKAEARAALVAQQAEIDERITDAVQHELERAEQAEARLREAEARVQALREERAMITVAVAHDHAQRATTDEALARLTEMACKFNTDAESACECPAHQVFRALRAGEGRL